VGGIQANIQYPVEFLIDNLDMGKNILLAARETGIQKVLNIASSCMYPREAVNPLEEKLILTGELEPTNEGYALAKILVARLSDYLVREDPTLHFKTIIPCNLYGKYDKFLPQHSHLVAAVIDKVYKARQSGLKEIEIWGDGTARREFMFAADLADFIWQHLDRIHELPQLLNVGYGTDYSVNEYYQLVAEALNFDGHFAHNIERPVGMKQKLMSNRGVTVLGWKPMTTLKEGIIKTIDYYVSIYG
jgi:GDP-L-fucose synthase